MKYPVEVITELNNNFNKNKVERILSFFDYVFSIIDINNTNWIDIPSNTMESKLGDDYYKTLKKLNKYIKNNESYNIHTKQCKKYTLNKSFIKILKEYNTIDNFKLFVNNNIISGSRKTNSINSSSTKTNNNNQSTTINNSNCSPILFRSFEDANTYSIDTDKLDNVLPNIYNKLESKKPIIQQSTIMTIKTTLNNILNDIEPLVRVFFLIRFFFAQIFDLFA